MGSYHEFAFNAGWYFFEFLCYICVIMLTVKEFTGWNPFKSSAPREAVIPEVVDTWGSAAAVLNRVAGVAEKYVVNNLQGQPSAPPQTPTN